MAGANVFARTASISRILKEIGDNIMRLLELSVSEMVCYGAHTKADTEEKETKTHFPFGARIGESNVRV